jgi:Cu/Ag efflux protein CusF
MKSFSRWVGASFAIVLLAGVARADTDSVANGTVKSIDVDKKEFVLTDSAGKDATIKCSEQIVIVRGGKDAPSVLKVGDAVDVCHDKGLLSWTAHFILVKEGETKDYALVRGTVKNYDADKKHLTFRDEHSKDWVFPLGDAKVFLNKKDSKIEDVKLGDNALVIVKKTGDKATLNTLFAEHK